MDMNGPPSTRTVDTGDSPSEHRSGAADSAPVQARRWLLIENPIAGSGRSRLPEAVRLLHAHNIGVDIVTTRARGDARRAARDAPDGVDAVIVAGGDGTINEAVNGLLERQRGAVPLGILPFGTANVLAGELGIPERPLPAARALLSARRRAVHLGELNGNAFLVMAGIGLDGRIVAKLSSRLKKRLGRLAYALELVREVLFVPAPTLSVTVDGERLSAATVVVANGYYYAGRFVLAPEARVTRRGLHVCLFLRGGRWALTRVCLAAVFGCLHRLSDVRVLPVTEVGIEGPAGEPIQADGDHVGSVPASIRVSDRTVEVMVPAQAV